MRQGVEIFVADGGQVLQADAAIDGFGEPLAAVDRHAVSARGQPGGELFGEGFESAVIGGNAARAEKGDAHDLQSARISAASRAASARRIFFGRLLADGRVLEPARHVFVVHAPAGLNQAALGQNALEVARQEPEGLAASVCSHSRQHITTTVARGDGERSCGGTGPARCS